MFKIKKFDVLKRIKQKYPRIRSIRPTKIALTMFIQKEEKKCPL